MSQPPTDRTHEGVHVCEYSLRNGRRYELNESQYLILAAYFPDAFARARRGESFRLDDRGRLYDFSPITPLPPARGQPHT